MLSHIFKYEWLSLTKNKLFVTVFVLTLLLSALSLWSGLRVYQRQVKQVAQIQVYEKDYYQSLAQKLDEIEKNGFQGSSHGDPSKPTTLALSKGFRYVYRTPFFMQIFNVGQSDLHPYYYKVTASKQQALYHSSEIKNGALSFIGNYDFSFVFIYLLPLLIIAFSFDMFAREKTEGTLAYLIQGKWDIGTVLLGRYLLRTLLFFGALWGLCIAFLVAVQGFSFVAYVQFWLWSLLLLAYTAFWFMLSFAVNSWGKNANYNAAALVFVWLFAVVLLPGILQYSTDKLYPVSARTDLITLSRAAGIEVQKKADNLMEDYIQDHPELAANKEGLNLKDFGTRYFVQLEQVEKAIKPVMTDFEARQQKHDDFVRNFSVLSPAILTQELMNELSATANHHYRFFAQDTKGIQTALRDVFVEKIFIGKPFTAAGLKALPKFSPKDSYYLPQNNWLFMGMALLIGLTALWVYIGLIRFYKQSAATFDMKSSF